MAMICDDFIAIAKELEEFYNIFTPELKSVTGKPHKIDEILERVHRILQLIENVNHFFRHKNNLLFDILFLKAPCDPFRIEDYEKWKMVTSNYQRQIEEIDEQTKSFTSESFKSLR